MAARGKPKAASKSVPSADEPLLVRVREVLASSKGVVEKRMMGGTIVMVDDHMCCGVHRGVLMIRCGATARETLLAEPHAKRFIVGKMEPKDFVGVDAAGFRTKAQLERWIGHGLAFVATLPPKKQRRR